MDAEATRVTGVPAGSLMECAGRSAAEVASTLYPHGRVVGVIGSGNNGGDALVMLRTLAAWGRRVTAVLVAARDEAEDAGKLLHGWPVERVTDRDLAGGWELLLGKAGVIADGILGTGVVGPPRARQAEAIRRVNASAAPVLALDVPSGISADTGDVPGEAVRADATVAFGGPKLGTLLYPGREYAGRIVAVEIGFPPWEPRSFGRVITPAWVSARLPRREPDTHKNAVGRVAVVAGGAAMGGAALLVARAAFRAGAGYLRICTHGANREFVLKNLPEAVVTDWDDRQATREALRASDAVALGPGLGVDEVGTSVLTRAADALPPGLPAIADADALNLAAAGRVDLAALARTNPMLLTPHAGEAARLLGVDANEIKRDRPGAVRELATRFGCAVLLKGAPSLVLAPGESLLVDATDSSGLAVAGMGDTLTGTAAALVAASLPPVRAAAAALHLTGRAADLADRGYGVIPSDVAELLPRAFAEIRGDRERPTGFQPPAAGVVLDVPASRRSILAELS